MESIAQEFLRIAHRLRNIQAEDPTDGEHYVKRLAGRAARWFRKASEDRVLVVDIRRRPDRPPPSPRGGWPHMPNDDVDLWYEAWIWICSILNEYFPLHVPGDAGVMRWTFVEDESFRKPDEELPPFLSSLPPMPSFDEGPPGYYQAEPKEIDWHERALDYAEICEFLAQLSAESQQPRASVAGKLTILDAGAGSSDADDRVAVVSTNEPRDKWIYEQLEKRVTYAQIIRGISEHPDWDTISSHGGVRRAAERYADRHTLDPPPKGRRGRPRRRHTN